MKACNNDLSPPKEKHMQTLLLACGGGQGNHPDRVSVSDINYVLNSISRIISKASGWISMLKSHIVLHRLFQECGGKFQREFFHLAESLRNTRSGGKEQDLFSLKYWKDDSSRTAFELSGWVRAYALYFEEYTCCAKFWPFLCSQGGGSTPMQSYEFDKLLQHVPVTQTLMRRLTDCEPVGEILQRNDSPVRAATALIFKDSLKVFKLANEGVCALVGSFFEQDKSKARKGLEIYKRSLVQHEDLQRLYTTCHNMQIVNKVPALEAPPETFLATMQEYVDTAKVGEMPAGVGARRTNKPSGDASSQSSLVATSSASTTPQQNANATLDALFGEMNIQTPPQNARDPTNTGVSAAGDFVAAGTTPSTSNDDPFGLANINNGNTRGQHQQAQPAASTSTTPSQLPPPIRAHQPPPQQQQEQQQQQQQQQQQPARNASNNPFGDDLFGTPKKAAAAPVDLNSLYDQVNSRQQQSQPQYGGGMMPPMNGGMPQQMIGNPGYYQQQQQQQQQQFGGGRGGGPGYPPHAQNNMGYPPQQMGQYNQQQQTYSPQNFNPQYALQQQLQRSPQQQQHQPSTNTNTKNTFLL